MKLGTQDRPLRVAIVGSGPSGFYAAESFFREKDLVVDVDMFDRLAAPYGLVRYGVAPDHQKMKAVIKVYEKTASNARFRFFGNVSLGSDLSVEDLRNHYDQIVYAVGTETDRHLGIPGEELEGSYGATAFVGWYNGHPDYLDRRFDLSHERAVIVGVGNVAMDVTRVLLRHPDERARTDIAPYALEALRESRVREVVLLGRRGPAQAAFSPKEIEEVGKLRGVDLVVSPAELELSPEDEAALEPGSSAAKNVKYLRVRATHGAAAEARRTVLRFFVSPTELLGESGKLTAVTIEKNELVADERGVMRSRGTGQTERLDAGLVFRSIGYHGVAIPGVPFDTGWGTIPNDDGRVLDARGGARVPGEYVVGWAKRGPTGLIGTNRGCSAGTVAHMVEDVAGARNRVAPEAGPEAIPKLLASRQVRFVTFDDWRRLDALEIERGEAAGKVREKILRVGDALEALAAANRR